MFQDTWSVPITCASVSSVPTEHIYGRAWPCQWQIPDTQPASGWCLRPPNGQHVKGRRHALWELDGRASLGSRTMCQSSMGHSQSLQAWYTNVWKLSTYTKELNGLSASTQALFTWHCASKALAKSCIKYKKFGVKLELPPSPCCVVCYVTPTHSPDPHLSECLSGVWLTAVWPPQCYWPRDKNHVS